MNSKTAKRLRRIAEAVTSGQTQEETRKYYRSLKRQRRRTQMMGRLGLEVTG